MEVVVCDQAAQIKKTGVSPIRSREQISRTGTGLQTGGSKIVIAVAYIRAASRQFRTQAERCLGGSTCGVSTVEPVFNEGQRITQPGALNRRHTGHFETIRNQRKQNCEIEVIMKAPSEIEIVFLGECRPRCYWNTSRSSRHRTTSGEN